MIALPFTQGGRCLASMLRCLYHHSPNQSGLIFSIAAVHLPSKLNTFFAEHFLLVSFRYRLALQLPASALSPLRFLFVNIPPSQEH